LAFLNWIEVAPLDVATWYGISSPCSMLAFCWSAVTTRGLDTILPLPSDSIADSSRFRNRLAAALNRTAQRGRRRAQPAVLAGRFTNCESGK
jgi:hypothetical protein